MRREEIISQACEDFRAEMEGNPPMTLRGGAAVDGYDEPPPFEPALDEPTR